MGRRAQPPGGWATRRSELQCTAASRDLRSPAGDLGCCCAAITRTRLAFRLPTTPPARPQVHTILPNDQGAQLLLLGHRRIEQTGLVSADPLKVGISHLKDLVSP